MKISLNENTEDFDLLRSIRKGDEKAFTCIYQRYHKVIYVLAFRYLKAKPMAEDVVQYVFTKLWEQRTDLLVSVNLRNYLYTMARNHILNQIRDQNQAIIKNYQIAQSQPKYEDNLLETIEQKELRTIFSRAVELLPEQKRKIWLLKMKKEHSNQDIADQMNLSVNTVKTHYAQTLKILRKHLEKMLIIVIFIILSSL